MCDDCDAKRGECSTFCPRRQPDKEAPWKEIQDYRGWMEFCKEYYLDGGSLEKIAYYHAIA